MKVRHWQRFGPDHPYDRLVREVVARRATKKSAPLAKLVVDVLNLAKQRQEPWIPGVDDSARMEMALRDCVAEARYQDGAARVYLSRLDETYDVPLNVGVQPYGPGGVKEKWSQRELFIDLPRAEFDDLLNRQRAIRDTEDGKLASLEEYNRIWARFPAAQSAREACVMAGIDPFDIAPPDQQTI